MREVLTHYRSRIDSSSVLKDLGLAPDEYFLVSAHRQENVDSPARLAYLLDSLKAIHEEWKLPIMVSTHPRTRKQLETIPGYRDIEGVTFHEPFGFLDYNKLQLNAKCVLSDSGTISEESTILGFPAITIRDSIERPEALEFGGIIMTGLGAADILAGIRDALASEVGPKVEDNREFPQGYEVSDCSSRVVKFMLSTISKHHDWAGIRKLD
jgi:UDP-N-acetylglucosamine 2-epimerase (non-hydrolysing)